MISFKQKGNFERTERSLEKLKRRDYIKHLDKYGAYGVQVLSAATPIDTGETRSSWSYSITSTKNGLSLSWNNSNVAGSVPVVILLQYGHGTPSGVYVQGRDFINPSIRPVMDQIAKELWKEVRE